MDLDDYQTQAGKTAIYSDADAVVYPLLGLCSEVGELQGKYKNRDLSDFKEKQKVIQGLLRKGYAVSAVIEVMEETASCDA